ncbi:unnamed protein product [Nezara viridula]|uniref:Uncharacterized protein n=1 Tax=Nezara viridula TaxID=85310 RepID=A0A9P0E605_NEZVI|nr:unnamed protein product [Nezara viridula]
MERMVNLDCGRIWTAGDMSKFVEDYRTSTDGFNYALENENDVQGFSWEETVSKLFESRRQTGLPISRKSCEIIAQRGAVQIAENKYRFTHDKRLKFRTFGRCTDKMLYGLAERISFDVLNIVAKNGITIHFSKSDYNLWRDHLKKIDKGGNLVNVTVDGGHHVHLENPEVVAPLINDFFKR